MTIYIVIEFYEVEGYMIHGAYADKSKADEIKQLAQNDYNKIVIETTTLTVQ